jgi:hypothetical protein
MFFQAPIGTQEERNSGKIWPGKWTDATPYLTSYAYGIHTGADLNLNVPGGWDSDAHSPVYSIGSGIVTYAQRWPNPKYWGNIVIVNHGMVDGKPLFSRYAHVENIRVTVGQPVEMGDQVAQVGNGFGLFMYHLHFDISATTILLSEPQNWPAPASNKNRSLVMQHYIDPKQWLQMDHVVEDQGPKPSPTAQKYYVIALAGSRLYKDHGLAAEQGDLLPCGRTPIYIVRMGSQDGYVWGQVSGGKYDGQWLAIQKGEPGKAVETYLSTNQP